MRAEPREQQDTLLPGARARATEVVRDYEFRYYPASGRGWQGDRRATRPKALVLAGNGIRPQGPFRCNGLRISLVFCAAARGAHSPSV